MQNSPPLRWARCFSSHQTGAPVFRRKACKAPSSSHHVKSACYQRDLAVLLSTLLTWPRWFLSGFPTLTFLFTSLPQPPALPSSPLWWEVTVFSSPLKSGRCCSASLRVKNLLQLFGIPLRGIFVLFHSFIIYTSTDCCLYGSMDVYFILRVIIQYYFTFCAPFSTLGCWELLQSARGSV